MVRLHIYTQGLYQCSIVHGIINSNPRIVVCYLKEKKHNASTTVKCNLYWTVRIHDYTQGYCYLKDSTTEKLRQDEISNASKQIRHDI